MLSLRDMKAFRNYVIAARCMAIVLFVGGLMMMSITSTTIARVQGQVPGGKFRTAERPIPNQYIVVLNDEISGSEVLRSQLAWRVFTVELSGTCIATR